MYLGNKNEFIASQDQRIKFISGFGGSSGILLVTGANAYLFTDSRYWEQAEKEVNKKEWTIVKNSLIKDALLEILNDKLPANVGFDECNLPYCLFLTSGLRDLNKQFR